MQSVTNILSKQKVDSIFLATSFSPGNFGNSKVKDGVFNIGFKRIYRRNVGWLYQSTCLEYSFSTLGPMSPRLESIL
jgi:hypothetical protein